MAICRPQNLSRFASTYPKLSKVIPIFIPRSLKEFLLVYLNRKFLWRIWLHWRSQRTVNQGHILWGGVLPGYRRQGIGRQLWQKAIQRGIEQSWKMLTIGPLPTSAEGNGFLQAMGAKVQQIAICCTDTSFRG